MSDVTFDMSNNSMQVHQKNVEPWKVTLVDTGDSTQTGGRLKRVKQYVGAEDFCMTYGDGVGDVDITGSIKFHKSHGKLATMTATQPPARFGALDIRGTDIKKFLEKPHGDGGWINGGFFVLSPKVFELIEGDETYWERAPLENLAKTGNLQAYMHKGFWQPMDTLRDKTQLEELWLSGKAPWKVWE
jgi:glucose-1-phosphate cytidylyltransferase